MAVDDSDCANDWKTACPARGESSLFHLVEATLTLSAQKPSWLPVDLAARAV